MKIISWISGTFGVAWLLRAMWFYKDNPQESQACVLMAIAWLLCSLVATFVFGSKDR